MEKHSILTLILTTCLLRTKHIQPKPKKKIYATIDSCLKRITASYNFESVNDYLGRVAANVKLNC